MSAASGDGEWVEIGKVDPPDPGFIANAPAPPKKPKQYSGVFEFAIGEVYGLRTWRQDDLGRLRARHVEDAVPWTPGLNTATCLQHRHIAAFLASFGVPQITPETAQAPADVPAEQCTCGFYAYTRETAESFEIGGILGVIRGSGRTLIGTKGFRCEKAEIVAVLDPRADGRVGFGAVAGWQQERLRQLYPDLPLLGSRAELLDFAPIEWTEAQPVDDDFWTAP